LTASRNSLRVAQHLSHSHSGRPAGRSCPETRAGSAAAWALFGRAPADDP
jgi:hypothetical protein